MINETIRGNKAVAITGTSQGEETVGVQGIGDSVGVRGEGKNWHGVAGLSESTIGGNGVYGSNKNGTGVRGESETKFNAGVFGLHKGQEGWGVRGEAGNGTGVVGESKAWMGVYGKSESTTGGAGVMGEAAGSGVIGKSETWMGVYGETQSSTGGAGVMGEHKANGTGIAGKSVGGYGLWASSETSEGVHAETKSTTTAAVAAYQANPTSETAALYAKHAGNRTAAVFEGDVVVTGDIRLTNADCAEDFTIADADLIEAGTVMVLGDEGALYQSLQAYDKRVAGVVSGAGSYKPGIVLDKQASQIDRKPIALLGKVYCKADAKYDSIEVGDLLTTSPSPGHAMKASDQSRAFGAVIGKALRPLRDGQGLIPILIALQ